MLSQHEIVIAERTRLAGGKTLFDQDAIIREILTNNLYGVDLSPESVEIAQLALWLNTARKDKPLSNLDHHIREGNSLVGPDYVTFYKNQHDSLFDDLDADEQEKVNPFDWKATFPEVFGDGVAIEDRGFDCVIGNPPYVKLQNFRKIKPDESEYLLHHKSGAGVPVYASTQTGNVDLYLPFIEKGIALLNTRGRMGYIAPNVWLKNDYGEGLRKKLKETRQLDRWIDFKSYQVFDEATVYTAIQFFTKLSTQHLRFDLSPNGEVVDIDWAKPNGKAPISKLSESEPWILLYDAEWKLLRRLNEECKRLDDESLTTNIFQGLITSADWCYHLDRTEEGLFIQTKTHPDKSPPDGVKYQIEPELMKPLVSGREAKRYITPKLETYLLYPYKVDGDNSRLWTEDEMKSMFPNAWQYLKRYEKHLRSRESGKMDREDDWWGYVYPKNLDKHEPAKLMVPRLVEHLIASVDAGNQFYLDNVDVGGVLPKDFEKLFFLAAILNAPVADFCFRQISKPFRGGFLSANRQFIAPIPIPTAEDEDAEAVGKLAALLQEKHTEKKELVSKLQQRVDSPNCIDKTFDEEWLWAAIRPVAELKASAPANITAARSRTSWAREQRKRLLESEYEKLDSLLREGMKLHASHDEDSLSVKGCIRDAEVVLVKKYGLDPKEAESLAALWTQILRSTNVTEKFNGKSLVKKLLSIRIPNDDGLRKTILELNEKIADLDREIHAAETEINKLIYDFYKLTPEEIALVESAGQGGAA